MSEFINLIYLIAMTLIVIAIASTMAVGIVISWCVLKDIKESNKQQEEEMDD